MTNTRMQYSITEATGNTFMIHNLVPVILVSSDTIHKGLVRFKEKISIFYQFCSALSLFLTSLSVSLTTEKFNDFIFAGGKWETIYSNISFFTGIWLAVTFLRMVMNWRKMTVEHAVDEICGARLEEAIANFNASVDVNYKTEEFRR